MLCGRVEPPAKKPQNNSAPAVSANRGGQGYKRGANVNSGVRSEAGLEVRSGDASAVSSGVNSAHAANLSSEGQSNSSSSEHAASQAADNKLDASEPTHNQPEASEPTYKERPIAFAILLGGALCIGMGQSVLFALLPPIARDLGLADFQVATVFIVSAVFWVVVGPFWGRTSDARGRRVIVLLGIGGFALSMGLFIAILHLGMTGVLVGFPLFALLVFSRAIYGVFGSAQPPAAQAYIADRTPPAKRASGLAGFSAALGIGATIGPAISALGTVLTPLSPLIIVTALAVLAWLAVFFFLPENNPPRSRQTAPPILSPRDKRIAPFMLCGFVGGIAYAIPLQMMGFYFLDILGLDNDAAVNSVGAALTTSALAALFAQIVLVRRLNVPIRNLLRYGALAACLGQSLFAMGTSFAFFLTAALFAGLGNGMIMSGFPAAASLAVSKDEQGATAGVANAATASGFIIAPIVGFTAYAANPRAPFILAALATLALSVYAHRSPAMKRFFEGLR